jgi:hypothetical protein
MARRSAAISIICGFGAGLSVLVSASMGSLAGDLSAALVLCDRIAADPADPDKPADVKGVTEIAPSDVATAIKFCKIAAPAARRALYQLGRAYAANRQLRRASSSSAPPRAAIRVALPILPRSQRMAARP